MECPFCNAKLEDNGVWGYLASHQSGEVLGHTFKCPNSEGFEYVNDSKEYLKTSGETIKSLGFERLGDVVCESANHSVCGSFYTNKSGDLIEGYPC